MAPGGGGKRKRPDRQYSQDDGRPSPHRPEALPMAQHGQRHDGRDGRGGGRGDGRRGRGGYHHQAPYEDRRPRQTNPMEPRSSPSNPTPTVRSPRTNHARTQTATPANSTPARLPPPQPVVVPRRASPPPDLNETFEWEYFKVELVKSWEDGGRTTCKEAASDPDGSVSGGTWVLELVQSAIRRRIDPTDAGTFFREVVESKSDGDHTKKLQDLLVDIVSLLPSSDWTRLSLSQLIAASGVPIDTWRMALDTECVEALGMARERFSKRKAAKITNYLYRQSNYNLLREESEGYAKLITEYFNISQNASAMDSPPSIALDAFDRVKALVGSFDLDVGRVLDITLDVFANLLVRNFRFFVKFIRASSWWPGLDCPDIIRWEGQGFDSLPEWALPSSKDWGVGQEETDRMAKLKPLQDLRDTTFWAKVREQGIDAFYDIGAKRITNFDDEAVQQLLNTEVQAQKDDIDSRKVEKNQIKRLRTNDRRKWMRATRTLPPSGNADAATLLGFKLSFYASPARDKDDVMPDNLVFLAALLIKIGFISLRDIYPHIYPPDEKMDDVKAKLEKERDDRQEASRSGGAPNKLALSGALPDDMAPPLPAIKSIKDTSSSKASSPKPEGTPKPGDDQNLSEPPDQKIVLLKSLLAIGALPDALFILGRFPWLAELVPDLPQYIHRILHHMLTKVYEPSRPLRDREDITQPQDHLGDSAGRPKGTLNNVPTQKRSAKRWANLDRPDQGDGMAYKFYWDDWTDNVPVCQTVDDVFLMCSTFLNFTGVKIGQDPTLLLKLVRIGKRSLGEDRSQENEARWIDLSKRLLVPALSLTTKNPGVANEMFELLNFFSTSVRYSVYSEWHKGPTARLPEIDRAFKATKREAQDVMKRISKTNVKQMGKALAKAAYGSPGIVLQTAINQMESYENMIEVFVECSRYFTFLGYDVLTWCLLNALGGESRQKIQADGMLTSSWLRALSTFAGAIYKRYSTCDPLPVLHYIASELRSGDTTNLELLEQMVVAMTGIKSDMIFNDAQVLAMAGGEVLQSQTLKQMADERHTNQRPSKRLMKALSDSGLAGQILIAVAQERQMYPYRVASKEAPLKVLGNNVDKIHQVFVQYLEAYRSNSSIDQFATAVPDPVTLMRDFGLNVEIAFMIGRAGIAQEVARIDAIKKAEQQEKNRAASNSHPNPNGDITMAGLDDSAEKTKPVSEIAGLPNGDSVGQILVASEDAIIEDADIKVEESQAKAITGPPIQNTDPVAWHPALTSIVEAIPSIIGEKAVCSISVPFYVTFWTLDLQDIVISNSSYDQELSRQTALVNQARGDRSDVSASGLKERERKIKTINELKDKLTKEMRSQIGTYTQVRTRLNQQKDHWFTNFSGHRNLNAGLLQYCFLPRIALSSLDAYYTFSMIKFLHGSGARSFYTMHLYNMIFDKFTFSSILFSATAREAENFGRFVNEVLKDLAAWHADRAAYEKNAIGTKTKLPGFANKVGENGEVTGHVDYESFRNLLKKWHNQINQALGQCFESPEYMHIRNAIIALKAFHTQFPRINFIGAQLLKHLSKLSETEERGDLKLAALSLVGNLKPLEKTWILPQAFSSPPEADKGSATPNGQGGNATPKRLNAQAPEFKPTESAQKTTSDEANGVNGIHDAEDGEIDDEKVVANGAHDIESMDVDSSSMKVQEESERLTKDTVVAPRAASRPPADQPDGSAGQSRPTDGGRSTPVPRQSQGLQADTNGRSTPRSGSRDPPRLAGDRSTRSGGRSYQDDHGRLDRPPVPGKPSTRADAYSHRTDDGRSSPRIGESLPPKPGSSGDRDHRNATRDTRAGRDLRDLPAPTGPARSSDRQATRSEFPNNSTQPASKDLARAPEPTPTKESINPARRALIENDRLPSNADDKRERLPRGDNSPRRDLREPRGQPAVQTRYDRSEEAPGSNRMSDRRGDPAPTGPRHDREAPHEGPPRRPSNDLFSGVASSRTQQDPSYGRLNAQAPSRQVDPSYGRLNAPEAPSGPKSSAPSGRAVPTGPQTRQQGSSPTIPQQPAAQSRSGIRDGQATASAPATPAREDPSTFSNVHPSRRQGLEPIDTATPARPSANAATINTPTAPSPASRGPPAGPSSIGARNDRRFAGINDTLQGSPAQGASIRGRATRSGGAPVAPTPAGPAHSSTPTAPQAMPPPQSGARSNEPARGPGGRSAQPLPPQQTPPRSSYDQRGDYPPPSRDGRNALRSGPSSREPSRDPVREDMPRRADYRGPLEPDPRARPSSAREDYYPESAPRGGFGRDDPYARGGGGPPPTRPGSGYPPESRPYPPSSDPYAGGSRGRGPADDLRGPAPAYDSPRGDYRGPDSRGGYGPPRADTRDDRQRGWADQREDPGRDGRKRRGDDMGMDPAKRRRSGA